MVSTALGAQCLQMEVSDEPSPSCSNRLGRPLSHHGLAGAGPAHGSSSSDHVEIDDPCEALDALTHTGRSTRSAGVLDQHHLCPTGAAEGRHQGVLHQGGSGRTDQEAAAVESEQTEPGTIPDVHYDFTQFGLDRSQGPLALNLRSSLIVDPPDGRIPPLTAEGQRRAAERAEARKRAGGPYDAAQNQPLSVRCIIMDRIGPPMLAGAYNNNYQIVQVPGYVMILAEMIHDVRIIPLDGRPHLPQQVRQWTGSYRGHWEGDTLVVETRNFNGKNPFQGSSENMVLTERFTRVDENTHSISVHRRRPDDVDEAVVRRSTVGEDGGPALRARLSRRKLRPGEHPRRGSNGRAASRRGRQRHAQIAD